MPSEVLSRTVSRLAVLIDADNAEASLVEPLLKEVANYGNANVARIYGDWTRPQLTSWKDKLLKFAIQPIQQFSYTSGKNSTDSALIIDAMDLLYSNTFDGFCIVSSDSDFTRLACRIRASGLFVYGFGEKKTPEPFVKACDKFIYIEIFKTEQASTKDAQDKLEKTDSKLKKNEDKLEKTDSKLKKDEDKSEKTDSKLKDDREVLKVIKDAYKTIAKDDGWANIGQLGNQLSKLSPPFDTKKYGHGKLGKFIQAIDVFEIKGSKIKLRNK